MLNQSQNYDGIINQLAKESSRASWSNWYAVALMLISLLILATVMMCILAPFANMLVMMMIFLAEGIALFAPIGLYYRRAGTYMQNRCFELENTYPGILVAYDEWRQKELKNAIPSRSHY